MKITEYKGEDALDLLVDILDPVSNILKDKAFEILFKTSGDRKKLLKYVIKHHKKDVLTIMARVDNEEYNEYIKKVNIFTLPKKLLELFDNEEVLNFFVSQGLKMDNAPSGSVMESIEETETM